MKAFLLPSILQASHDLPRKNKGGSGFGSGAIGYYNTVVPLDLVDRKLVKTVKDGDDGVHGLIFFLIYKLSKGVEVKKSSL